MKSKWVVLQGLKQVTLGVPKLGIIKELYDFDDPSSCETLDKNVEMGCMVLRIVDYTVIEKNEASSQPR